MYKVLSPETVVIAEGVIIGDGAVIHPGNVLGAGTVVGRGAILYPNNVIEASEIGDGAELTAIVARDNVMGCQFHPEKSGNVGLRILRAFCESEGKR